MSQFNSMPLQGLQSSLSKKKSPFEDWNVPEINQQVPNSRLIPERDLQRNEFDGTMSSGESSFDPRALLHQLDSGLSDEFGGRFRQEQGLKERGFGAAPMAMKGLQADADERLGRSPLTAQRKEYDQFNTDATAAYNEGFKGDSLANTDGSSALHGIQERAAYGRKQKEDALNMDLRVAEENNRGGLARAQENSRGIIRQAEIGADSRLGQAQNLIELQRMLGGRSVSLPGGGSIGAARPERPLSPANFTPMNQARQLLEDAKAKAGNFSLNPFSGFKTTNDQEIGQREAEFDQAAQAFLNNHPADNALKSWAFEASRDPRYKGKALEDVLEMEPQDDLDEFEYGQLRELWNAIGRR